MLFRLTMWFIGFRIARLIKNDKKFVYAVRDKQAVLQFALGNGKPVRYFEFDKGAFKMERGRHSKSELARTKGNLGERVAVFTFESSGTAMKLLIKGMKDDTVMLAAIRERKLVVEGDFSLFIWFGWLAEQI